MATTSAPVEKCRFEASDGDGNVVALRWVTEEDLSCARAAMFAGGDECGEGCAHDEYVADGFAPQALEDPYEGEGEEGEEWFGYGYEAEVLAPTWVRRDPGCDGGEVECACGLVDLAEVLGTLAPHQRSAAVAAHLGMIHELGDHLMALLGPEWVDAEPDGEGGWGQDGAGAGAGPQAPLTEAEIEASVAGLVPVCVTCLVDPEAHRDDLEDAISERCSEMAYALSFYHTRIQVGPERQPR